MSMFSILPFRPRSLVWATLPLALVALAMLALALVGTLSGAPAAAYGGAAGTEPANVQVTPGDGTLTVTWTVTSRDGYADGEIRHALRWSQVSGVWANPSDPDGPGRNDGISVEGGVTSYVITGLENGVATGVFVRSFTGNSLSERSSQSSPWVRTKGDHTTPRAGQSQQQVPPKTFSISATASAPEGGEATLTITLSEAAPPGGVEFTVAADFGSAATPEDVGNVVSSATVAEGDTTLAIAVPAVDDAVDEDDETFTVSIAAVTDGWEKAGDGQDTATVTIIDDDTAGVTITPTTLNVAEGGSASYTVVLDSRPTAEVTITAVSSDPAKAAILPASFVIRPEDWELAEIFTVNALSDADSGDESVSISHGAASSDGKYDGMSAASVAVAVDDDDAPAQEPEPQEDAGPEPYNVQVLPGDGMLTVTWTATPREGYADDEIRHALRWSQFPGVWANPPDPEGPGPNDGITVAGGVNSYVITGLKNGVATGVFVRSFVGSSLSERSEHSSEWVRTKGDHTTPRASHPQPVLQTPEPQPQQQDQTPAVAQDDATLSDLKVYIATSTGQDSWGDVPIASPAYAVSPAVSSSVTEYEVRVPEGWTADNALIEHPHPISNRVTPNVGDSIRNVAVVITPTAGDQATIAVSGKRALGGGETGEPNSAPKSGQTSGPWGIGIGYNWVDIVVTAPDGETTQSYTVKITQGDVQPPENVQLTPGDAQLELTWDAPAEDLPWHYFARWRVAGTQTWLNPNGRSFIASGRTTGAEWGEIVWSIALNAANAPLTYTITELENGEEYEVELAGLRGGSRHPSETAKPERKEDYLESPWVAAAGTGIPDGTVKLPLTITPTAPTRAYGESDDLSYTVGGLATGDAAADVVGGALARDAGDDVGSYAINMGTLAIKTAYAAKYKLPAAPAVTSYTITARPVTYTATAANKGYDGTTAPPSALGGSFAAGNIIAGDTVTVDASGAAYAGADAATGIAITGLALAGADAANYAATFSVTGDITPRPVTYTATAADKVYDGATSTPATLGGSFAAGNIIAGDTVTVDASGGAYAGADTGTGIAITGLALGGADAANYAATFSVTGDITPRPITAISGVTVVSRLSDGTTGATFDTSGAAGTGVLPAELADFRAGGLRASGTFAAATAGSHSVSVTYTLQDQGSFKAGNYSLAAASATATLQGELTEAIAAPTPGCNPVGRDDSTDDPLLINISTLAELNAIRWDPDGDGVPEEWGASRYEESGLGCPDGGCTGYELTADLDFDTNGNGRADSGDAYWNDGMGWKSIGQFNAVFDGNGHTISNLYINRDRWSALFLAAGPGAVIRNVGLESVDVTGQSGLTAGLVARNDGKVIDSYVTGSVSGKRIAAGLVAWTGASSMVIASYSTADVSGTDTVGGLVGSNVGAIIAGCAAGDVSSDTVYSGEGTIGGLAGDNDAPGYVIASYATGDVSVHGSKQRVGGLIGLNRAPVAASYSIGDVSGGSRHVGGLIGQNTSLLTHSYWNSETASRFAGGRTTAQLTQPTGYTGIYANWNLDLDGDGSADDPWDFGTDSQYPTLQYSGLKESTVAETAGETDYDADGDGLIEISSLAQLNAMRWDINGDGGANAAEYIAGYAAAFPDAETGMGCPSSGCLGYELNADLDFDTNGNGRADAGDDFWNGGRGWTPIQDDGLGYYAVFEGNGHTIGNLYINQPSGPHVGLFRDLIHPAEVRNVGLVSASVSANLNHTFAGALAGQNGGTVSGSYMTGSVSGAISVGGLVGANTRSGVIAGSYADGRVFSHGRDVGGLVGFNWGKITASYSTGRVASAVSRYSEVRESGGVNAGGLVGYNDGSVAASYAVGRVSGSGNNVGGLIGFDKYLVTASYWDTQTSGQSASAAGVGKATAELQQPTGYAGIYANWNVDVDGDGNADNPWDFGTSSQYPTLK